MKKILLVHPLGYIAQDAAKDISRVANLMPPLGLLSIASYLEQFEIKVDIIDCFAHPDSDVRIMTHLTEEKPDFIGLTCTTSSFLDAIRIIEMAKSTLPSIQAVMGGAHISATKSEVLKKYACVDYAVVGEGENPLRKIITGDYDNLSEIKGLIFRDQSAKITFNGPQPHNELLPLDTLPFPAYEKLAGYPEAYKLPIFNYPKAPNAASVSSRGCPYTCSYCDRSVFGKSYRYNSAEYVYKHMQYMRDRWNIKHINFYDDQFTFNHRRVNELCDLLINQKLGMTFNCAVRAEHVNLELLKKMKQAGCWMISLGIETGDTELLKQHRSHANLDRLTEAIYMIKKAGIRVKGLLMLGLPGETEATVKTSMEYVFKHPIDDFNLAKFTPFPGTPLYPRIREYGTFDEDPTKMDCMHFVFVTHGMTEEKLEKLFIKFYKSHYSRPKVHWSYITMIWKSPDSWKRFIKDFLSFLRFVSSNQRIQKST